MDVVNVAENAGIGGDVEAQQQAYVPYVMDYVFGTGHGGQNGMAEMVNNVYGSVFSPSLPGTPAGPASSRQIGAGAIIATVSGACTLDGRVSVDSAQNFAAGNLDRPPSPGSIALTVGSLAGSGVISANGLPGNITVSTSSGYGPSGGGRISIRLTDKGADFSAADLERIQAQGVTQSAVNSCTNTSSAGTIYLETAAQAALGGVIHIVNDGKTGNLAYTPIPAAAYADAVADFEKASLSLLDCGKVRLYETLTMAKLMMAADTKLDLNGNKLTVNAATLGDTTLEPGTYAASAYADFLTGEGSLVVVGAAKRGTVIIYR